MSQFEQLADQKHLNFETFRKNGESMKTPVWFVQDGGTIYVRTIENSGKVKRVHRNPGVNIAPCEMDGQVIGAWIPAKAKEVKSLEIEQMVDRLLTEKYGPIKKKVEDTPSLQGRKYTILEITYE
jgi:uncharacterized protein